MHHENRMKRGLPAAVGKPGGAEQQSGVGGRRVSACSLLLELPGQSHKLSWQPELQAPPGRRPLPLLLVLRRAVMCPAQHRKCSSLYHTSIVQCLRSGFWYQSSF